MATSGSLKKNIPAKTCSRSPGQIRTHSDGSVSCLLSPGYSQSISFAIQLERSPDEGYGSRLDAVNVVYKIDEGSVESITPTLNKIITSDSAAETVADIIITNETYTTVPNDPVENFNVVGNIVSVPIPDNQANNVFVQHVLTLDLTGGSESELTIVYFQSIEVVYSFTKIDASVYDHEVDVTYTGPTHATIDAHIAANSSIHGVTSALLDTEGVQTMKNKTITDNPDGIIATYLSSNYYDHQFKDNPDGEDDPVESIPEPGMVLYGVEQASTNVSWFHPPFRLVPPQYVTGDAADINIVSSILELTSTGANTISLATMTVPTKSNHHMLSIFYAFETDSSDTITIDCTNIEGFDSIVMNNVGDVVMLVAYGSSWRLVNRSSTVSLTLTP